MRLKTLLSALVLSILVLAPSAFGADALELVSLNPTSPAAVPGVIGGATIGPGNSIEATLRYILDSASDAQIGVYTAGVAGNPPTHTGINVPVPVKKGKGEVKTRFSVKCEGLDIPIVRIRYALIKLGGGTLVEKFKDVKYEFRCKSTEPTGKKPDISFLRKGVYLWGSNPAMKHWVNFNQAVNLKPGESISPNAGNGPCRFNLEYYPKELNGAATGPFKNTVKLDGAPKVSDGPITLAASGFADRTVQIDLAPYGSHSLQVVLDDPNAVAETLETNNSGSISYVLEGTCTTSGPSPTRK